MRKRASGTEEIACCGSDRITRDYAGTLARNLARQISRGNYLRSLAITKLTRFTNIRERSNDRYVIDFGDVKAAPFLARFRHCFRELLSIVHMFRLKYLYPSHMEREKRSYRKALACFSIFWDVSSRSIEATRKKKIGIPISRNAMRSILPKVSKKSKRTTLARSE